MASIKFTSENADEVFITNQHGLVRITYDYDTPSVSFISTLIVSEEFRGKGYGTKLLLLAENDAKLHACDKVLLQVNKYSWMKSWYEKHGYLAIANGYDEGMLIMTKFINHES